MLRPRLIPCLLVQDKGLVKTVKFKDPKYVGDPINAVKIFNEKEVDELIIVDIDASRENREPDFKMIENVAAESRMPLCYGGGVKTAEHAKRIISLGAEKVAISAAVLENPELIRSIATAVGSQSVCVVLDIKKKGLLGKYTIFTHNGTKEVKVDLFKFVEQLEDYGAGELLINSIDNDGVMKGYDYKLMKKIRAHTNLPIIALGGAGDLEDMGNMFDQLGVMGAAAGSMFVFKGKYKAVLINYPAREERFKLFEDYT